MSTDLQPEPPPKPPLFRNVAVVGLGAMGGGMARTLLEQENLSQTVTGFDRSTELTQSFYDDSHKAGKHATRAPPRSLQQAICGDDDDNNDSSVTLTTDVVVLVLQNEEQCQSVCFEHDTDNIGKNLLDLLQTGSCVILCSTVTPAWARKASELFSKDNNKQIHFIDCPISGGPVRARQGELTLLASGAPLSLLFVQPILNALGGSSSDRIHIIEGGAGMGSTAKLVHQMLAGVHICAAAEALSLAASTGLNVHQFLKIVQGAAGNSWMFQDRGPRMLENPNVVKSQVQIFVKDLDIVYQEAKRLTAPIPLTLTALQQFLSAASLGLAQQDDSQVVQAYQAITGVSVAATAAAQSAAAATEQEPSKTTTNTTTTEPKIGTNVGEYWKMEDGTLEEIVEVGDEPRHFVILANTYVRAIRVSFPPGDTTLAHRHENDSLYYYLVPGGLQVLNHIQGHDPSCDCMEFGEVRFGTHATQKQPLVHKITNLTPNQSILCIDAEFLQASPVSCPIPLVADKHELIKTRDKFRVYKLTLEPGESVEISYPFFHLDVVIQDGTIETCTSSTATTTNVLKWTETKTAGTVAWREPTLGCFQKTNRGSTTYIEYITEWR